MREINMKSSVVVIFIAIFLLVCCTNGCVAKSIDNSENAVDFTNQITAPEADESTFTAVKHRRTERMANDMCTMEAFENMKAYKIVDLANQNPDCARMAAEFFQKQNYAGQFFHVDQNHRTTKVEIMKRFGNRIQKIAVDIDLCSEDRLEIEKTEYQLDAINKYCHVSLVQLYVTYNGCNRHNVFNQIKGPFDRVEFLHLNLSAMGKQAESRQLNEIFPNLRDLHIYQNGPLIQYSSLISEMPKLERLSIGEGLFSNTDTNSFIELLRKNPQITYVSLMHPTFAKLQIVERYLSNLQELHIIMATPEIFYFEKIDQSREIDFTTVKYLNIMFQYKCYPLPELVFSKAELQEVTLHCVSDQQHGDYIDFLPKYSRIRKLAAGTSLNDYHLSKLTGKFPNLNDVLFGFSKDIKANSIMEFVRKSPALVQMEFEYKNLRDFADFKEQLQTGLDADFNIEIEDLAQSNSKVFSIKRKRNVPIKPGIADGADLPPSNLETLPIEHKPDVPIKPGKAGGADSNTNKNDLPPLNLATLPIEHKPDGAGGAAHRISNSAVFNTFVLFAVVYATRFLFI